MSVFAVASATLAIWLYLLLARGGFWLARETDRALLPGNLPHAEDESDWPSVTAIIPARDEAEVMGETVASLLRQDYPGRFTLILVDDQSSDGTMDVARRAAAAAGAADRLTVIAGADLPPGWTGKLWAMQQGAVFAESRPEPPDFILFSDADIAYAPGVLQRLVAGARGMVLASLMVKLRCESAAERLLIPAFIFFFRKLYPFAWVNDPARGTAAAAGGCMLVRREALQAAGGLGAIRGALIDDCALGALLKRQGPI
jgi:hopene-associated glycosyltransferase HpnB